MPSLSPEDVANLATSIVLVSASVVPLGVAITMKLPQLAVFRRGVRVVKISTVLLGLFLLLHGLYHLSEFIGNDVISDDILEPLSIAVLLAFALCVKKFIFVPKIQNRAKLVEEKGNNDHLITKLFPAKTNLALGAISLSAFATLASLIMPFAQNPGEIFTLCGILVAAAIFSWMTVKNPALGSTHSDFAIIVLIWAAAEIPHSLATFGFVNIAGIDLFGTWVHFISMLFIGLLVCLKSFKIFLVQRSLESQVPIYSSILYPE